jgi:ribosomal protein S9
LKGWFEFLIFSEIYYFREVLIAPLLLTNKFDLVDVEATHVEGPGGQTVTPRAIRQGLSLGLAALYPECKELLRFGALFV